MAHGLLDLETDREAYRYLADAAKRHRHKRSA